MSDAPPFVLPPCPLTTGLPMAIGRPSNHCCSRLETWPCCSGCRYAASAAWTAPVSCRDRSGSRRVVFVGDAPKSFHGSLPARPVAKCGNASVMPTNDHGRPAGNGTGRNQKRKM